MLLFGRFGLNFFSLCVRPHSRLVCFSLSAVGATKLYCAVDKFTMKTSFFQNPENMYKLAVTTNSVVTASLPIMLQLISMFTESMAEKIETFEDDKEENEDYAKTTKTVASVSQWIAVLGGKALMFLNGFQTGKGKQNLTGKQAKTVQGFLAGFSVVAFAMLFTMCGMGIKMYNSAATWNEKVCAFPSSAATATSATAAEGAEEETDDKAEESENSAKAIYDTYIAVLVVFGIMFGVFVWFTYQYAEYAPIRGSVSKVSGGSFSHLF